jgi:hypothetical protein
MTNIRQNNTKVLSNIKCLFTPPLGNITNNSATLENTSVNECNKRKESRYIFKKSKAKRKLIIGKKNKRVACCGTKCIQKNQKEIEMVQGESGSLYYKGMMRCGSVWFCEDCMFKIMKERTQELAAQLKYYKDSGKTVLFITLTIQHDKGNRLKDLHNMLTNAFNFANTHRSWKSAQKNVPIEYLRSLEVTYGGNGWHPHFHALFVGDDIIIDSIKIFVDLYEQKLKSYGLLVNEHTTSIDKWNGDMDDMTEYMFKGIMEMEITGANLKSTKGKTFFNLVDDGEDNLVDEYMRIMKGKRQYSKSKGFFCNIQQKTDEEILMNDNIDKVIYTIPVNIYAEMSYKGIALHFLNEYEYGGEERAKKFLEEYDVDTGFMEQIKKIE